MHTIVVGAGIAGLWIASQLAAQGEQVTVLERDTVSGGRVRTSRYGYELGAGRLSYSHKRVAALVRRYGLHAISIGHEQYWIPKGKAEMVPNHFYTAWPAVISALKRLPPATLARHTLRELSEEVIGAKAATNLLDHYPYRAETERQRADIGIHCFDAEMGHDTGYYVVREGLSAIIRGLAKDLTDAGGRLLLNKDVTNIRHCLQADHHYSITTADRQTYQADRVILALPVTALKKLSVMRTVEALSYLDMAPLTRIYACYPHGWPYPRIITDSPLRDIIPINAKKGVVMISYTDDRDTAHWHGLSAAALKKEIQKEVVRLFPGIEEPRWVRPVEWASGTTYWKPGDYSPAEMASAAMCPRDDMPELYCCGESFSVYKQAWIEGALENAEMLFKAIKT